VNDVGGIVGTVIGFSEAWRAEVAYHDLSDADTAVADEAVMSSSATVLVGRRESFNAAHKLADPGLSDEDNRRLFGKCANLHGHNYVLEVVVAGQVDQATGYVLDLKQLSKVIFRRVIEDVDHCNLNTDVPWLEGRIPTAENLALAFWQRLRSGLPEGSLRSVRLWETDKNWAQVGDPA
jgi:6-pyruvoyltetrahydropterin/6-carboxytetrahydropterin synthase